MNLNLTTGIPEELQEIIYRKFKELPLKYRFAIYSKLLHNNSFKPQDNDLFGLNRKSVGKVYNDFIIEIKEEFEQIQFNRGVK